MNRRHRIVLAAAALAALSPLSGCSSTSAGSAGRASPSATTSPTNQAATATPGTTSSDLLGNRVLPLFAYEQSAEQRKALDQARNILTNRCLARFGFPPRSVASTTSKISPMYRRYGVTDPAIAKNYGYHIDPLGQVHIGGGGARADDVSDAEQLVLTGSASEAPIAAGAPAPENTHAGTAIPPRGCLGEASRALTAAQASTNETSTKTGLAGSLGYDAFGRSLTEPRVAAANKAWSKCMASKGFRFSSPTAALEPFDLDKPVGRTEIDTAVADVACKSSTGLVDIWFDVETDLQNDAIQKNIEALTAARDANQVSLEKALAVVTSPSAAP